MKSGGSVLVTLSGAVALSVKCLLVFILSETSFGRVKPILSALRRFLDFVQAQSTLRQVFIALGNCLDILLKVHVKFPEEGITEGIMVNMLGQLSEGISSVSGLF